MNEWVKICFYTGLLALYIYSLLFYEHSIMCTGIALPPSKYCVGHPQRLLPQQPCNCDVLCILTLFYLEAALPTSAS